MRFSEVSTSGPMSSSSHHIVVKWDAEMGLQFRSLGHSASAWGPDSETASGKPFSVAV